MPPDARCAYEIVIDGLSLEAVERATAAGLHAAADAEESVVGITAGNYGGNLGPFHIRLQDVLESIPEHRSDRPSVPSTTGDLRLAIGT